jgi:hypothetical protein
LIQIAGGSAAKTPSYQELKAFIDRPDVQDVLHLRGAKGEYILYSTKLTKDGTSFCLAEDAFSATCMDRQVMQAQSVIKRTSDGALAGFYKNGTATTTTHKFGGVPETSEVGGYSMLW